MHDPISPIWIAAALVVAVYIGVILLSVRKG